MAAFNTEPNVTDFASPFMTCALVTPKGDIIPLWTNTNIEGRANKFGETAKEYTGLTSLPFVNDLVIDWPLSKIPRITVNLTPPYRDAITLMDKSFLDWGRVSLMASVGYFGTYGKPVISPVFTGLMLMPNASFGENISITLTAQGPFSMFNNSNTWTFPKTYTRAKILQKVMDGAGVSTRQTINGNGVQDKLVAFFELDPKTTPQEIQDYWNKPMAGMEGRENIVFDNMTDYAVIKDLLDHSMCRWSMIDGFMVITPMSDDKRKVPTKVFTIMDYPGGKLGNGHYPILSVSTTNNGQFLPGAIKELTTSYINPMDKKSYTVKFTPNSVGTDIITLSGDGSAGFADDSLTPTDISGNAIYAAENANFMPSPKALEAYKHKAKLAQYITELQSVQVNIETLGIPTIAPNELVTVQGCSKRLDGNYLVFGVTHKFNAGGFSTSILLQSSAYKISKSEGVKGPSNTNAPATASNGTVEVQAVEGGK